MALFSRETRRGEYSAPRTVLGFYAGVLAILEAGVVGVLAVLATQDSLRDLIPYVLAFAGAVLVGLIVVVVAMNLKDPSKLQLSPMTGQEFIDYQRFTLGDSIGGDYVEEVPVVRRGQPRPAGRHEELPPPRNESRGEGEA
jgi:hypothetical protein